MVIGKSLTALGGGGLKPEIIVTAKEGVLLNLHYKDSSFILQSYQLGAEEKQHTFVVDISETAYVVEDVTNSKSVEVLVDSVALFNVKIIYTLWLYKDGDECTSITGGWSKISTTAKITKNSTNMVLTSTTFPRDVILNYFGTNNAVDITDYSRLYADVKMANGTSFYSGIGFSSPRGEDFVKRASKHDNTQSVIELDIDKLTGEYYPEIIVAARYDYQAYLIVYKVWLET